MQSRHGTKSKADVGGSTLFLTILSQELGRGNFQTNGQKGTSSFLTPEFRDRTWEETCLGSTWRGITSNLQYLSHQGKRVSRPFVYLDPVEDAEVAIEPGRGLVVDAPETIIVLSRGRSRSTQSGRGTISMVTLRAVTATVSGVSPTVARKRQSTTQRKKNVASFVGGQLL